MVPTFTVPFDLFNYTQQLVSLPLGLCKAVDWVLFTLPRPQNLWCKRPRAKEKNSFCIASNTLEFNGFRHGVLLKSVVMMKVIYEFKSWIQAGVLVSSEAWNCSAQVLDACCGYQHLCLQFSCVYLLSISRFNRFKMESRFAYKHYL